MLGIADPRVLYQQGDSELIGLWNAYLHLKTEEQTAAPPIAHTQPTSRVINHADQDRQFNVIERLLA